MISTITQNDLDLHAKYLRGEPDGQRLISDSGTITIEADLSGADLSGANLSGANLSGADLSGADLSGAKEVPAYVFAATTILPEGALTVYKKATCGRYEVMLTLEIPADAKRSNATGRKCRSEYAILRGIEGIGREYDGAPVKSKHDSDFVYPPIGARITPDGWDENRWEECSKGIHFFITRYEAENY